jgi:hypothetical protein
MYITQQDAPHKNKKLLYNLYIDTALENEPTVKATLLTVFATDVCSECVCLKNMRPVHVDVCKTVVRSIPSVSECIRFSTDRQWLCWPNWKQ